LTFELRFLRFDLNLLVALDALLTERNVTRAAERLNLGQSAMSSALARLRDYFNDELLVPSGRELRLSALAQTLVEPVRTTLRQAQATLQLQPGFDPATTTRRFTIASSDYVIQVLLVEVVRRLAELAPGLCVNLMRRPPDALEQLDRGRIDLLVVPDFYLASAHPSETLFEDRYVCLVWTGHRTVGDTIDAATYRAQPHVVARQRETRPYAFEDAHWPAEWQERRAEVFVDDFISVPELVVGTQRIATVQARVAEHALRRGLPLRVLPVPFAIPPLRQATRWHSTADGDPALVWVREQMRACALATAG
jgi:DNA-binding transcriptional LysR family regulator